MLYKLCLLENRSYEMLFEKEVLVVAYNGIDEEVFIDLILNVDIDDFIWINFKGKFSLAKVIDRPYIDRDRLVGLIKVLVFRYHGVLPSAILSECDGLELIDDTELLSQSDKIFNALETLELEGFDISNEESEEIVSLEFVKGENALDVVKSSDIVPYTKPKKNRRKDKSNFGELIIEVEPKEFSGSNLPVLSRGRTPAVKLNKDFYMQLIKHKIAFYEREEKPSINIDNFIWGRFFKR